MFKHSTLTIVAFVAALPAQTAFADITANKKAGHIFTLDKVTVAATLTEKKLKDVASTVSLIDQTTVENTLSTDIRDMIRYEPGIDVGSAGRFGLKGFNIRGTEENRVKILIDGVDQAKSFIPGGDFQRITRNFYDVDSLKQVEVVKGPASSLYGSNAIGGIVAMTTKDAADFLAPTGDDSAFKIKAAYTSEDKGKHMTFTAANRSGQLESLLIITARNTEELENKGDIGGEGDTRTKANPADNESENILVKLNHQLNDQHKIGLTAESLDVESEINLLSRNEYNDYSAYFPPGQLHFLEYADSRADDSSERNRISINHQWQANHSAFDSLNWQLTNQTSKMHHKTFDDINASMFVAMAFNINPGERLKDYEHEEESLQFNANFNKTVGNHQITYGVSYEDTEVTNTTNTFYLEGQAANESGRYIPIVDGKAFGAFIQDQITLKDGQLIVTPGIRYDDFEANSNSDDRFPNNFADHESDKTSIRLGAVYKFSEQLSGFAQYAQGFKTPELDQLYYERIGSTYRTVPNPDLDPEESDSLEIGLRHESNKGSLEVSLFYNDYDDYIDEAVISNDAPYTDGTTQSINIAEATIKGIEVRGALWLDEAFGMPAGTSLQGAIAYADGEGKNEGERDKPLNSINPLKAVIGLSYDAPKGNWGSTLNWTVVESKERSDLADENNFATPGYGIVDLTAYYKLSKQLLLRAGIFNITDKKYWIYEDVRDKENDLTYLDRFSQPGRNVSISATYEF